MFARYSGNHVFFKNLLFKSLAAFGFLPLPKAYWPSAPLIRSLTPVDPLANASRRSSSALSAEIWLESTRSATLRLKCLLAGSPGAKSFCLLWRISKNLDRLGLKQEKATLDRLADNQHPTWQNVSLEQYAKTGGLRPPCKFLGRSLPRKENGYFLAIFEQKPTQDAWHILTTLEILSWYIRTGVNKITPYQQMKCFTNKSVTSWFFGNEETAAIFLALWLFSFLSFGWFFRWFPCLFLNFFFNI